MNHDKIRDLRGEIDLNADSQNKRIEMLAAMLVSTIRSDDKIGAILALRAMTKMGLKEAKDAVEGNRRHWDGSQHMIVETFDPVEGCWIQTDCVSAGQY